MTAVIGLFRPRRWGNAPGAAAAATADVEGRLVAWRRADDAPVDELGPLLRGERLVVALHGLGADERQLSTLVPLEVPGAVVAPRGPYGPTHRRRATRARCARRRRSSRPS